MVVLQTTFSAITRVSMPLITEVQTKHVVEQWETFQMVCGWVALLDMDHVVVRLVAFVTRIGRRSEPDEAVVAAKDKNGSVDNCHDEAFLAAEWVAHSVQTAVHSRCYVAPVTRPDPDWPVLHPFHRKQSWRWPVSTPARSTLHSVRCQLTL